MIHEDALIYNLHTLLILIFNFIAKGADIAFDFLAIAVKVVTAPISCFVVAFQNTSGEVMIVGFYGAGEGRTIECNNTKTNISVIRDFGNNTKKLSMSGVGMELTCVIKFVGAIANWKAGEPWILLVT